VHSEVRSEPAPLPENSNALAGALDPERDLRPWDLPLLALFCLLLFGYSMFSGRPLSLHEARLPQVSREMMQNHDWLIPRSGGRPWLERPPLPHWLTVGVSAIFGQHCDKVWVVRLPAALAGSITVLLTAWIAARLFGRWTGICSALILATCYEFWTYSSLAEDDIFLAPLVAAAIALFVRIEFPMDGTLGKHIGFLNSRPWPVTGIFALLGLTNFVKGPLVGAAVVIGPMIAFLLPMRDLSRIRRYVWLWGWLLFLLLTLAWHLAMIMDFQNEYLDNLKFDFHTREFDNPFWYYPVQILGAIAPWTPAALIGLWKSWTPAKQNRRSVERFLWCWAIASLIVLSIPHRKHHHYLVPSIAPWAILAAIGLRDIARSMFAGPLWSRKPSFGLMVFGLPGEVAILLLHRKIPGPMPMTNLLAAAWIVSVGLFYLGLYRRSGKLVMGTFVAGVTVACCWGQTFIPDMTKEDTLFLHRVETIVPREAPLFIDADLHGELDFFRNQFYLRNEAQLLHNLTFLRDEKITSPVVYVITREWNAPKLAELGTAQIADQSVQSRKSDHAKKAKLPLDRFTLYRLAFRPDLARYPVPTHITTMQAMGRAKGPYCGPNDLPDE
jgi:4-amino-4-deoxy-L-arabinose transferase-like glycosyltransferase